jgi:hypothetical protein
MLVVLQRIANCLSYGVVIGMVQYWIVIVVIVYSSGRDGTDACHMKPSDTKSGKTTFVTFALLPLIGILYCLYKMFIKGDTFFVFSYGAVLLGVYTSMFGLDAMVRAYQMVCTYKIMT